MMREASRVKAATSSRLASIVMGMASTVMTGMVLSFKKVFDTQNYCAERFGKLSVFLPHFCLFVFETQINKFLTYIDKNSEINGVIMVLLIWRSYEDYSFDGQSLCRRQ